MDHRPDSHAGNTASSTVPTMNLVNTHTGTVASSRYTSRTDRPRGE